MRACVAGGVYRASLEGSAGLSSFHIRGLETRLGVTDPELRVSESPVYHTSHPNKHACIMSHHTCVCKIMVHAELFVCRSTYTIIGYYGNISYCTSTLIIKVHTHIYNNYSTPQSCIHTSIQLKFNRHIIWDIEHNIKQHNLLHSG